MVKDPVLREVEEVALGLDEVPQRQRLAVADQKLSQLQVPVRHAPRLKQDRRHRRGLARAQQL